MNTEPLIEQFVADVCAGKANETPAAYRSKLKRFSKFTDAHGLTVEGLRREHIQSFRGQLIGQREKRMGSRLVKGHLSPFTIHTVSRTLKHFLKWLYQKGWTDDDLSDFKMHPPPLPDPKAVDAVNVLHLLQAASRMGEHWEQARNLAMLYVLRDSGGRIGAILNADLDNLDIPAGRIYVKEKGGKPHTLYINNPARTALRLWIEHRPQLKPRDRKLFITCKGAGMSRSGFYSMLRRLIEAAGLRGRGRVNPQAFRHAWAREALDAGEDLSRVSQTLGHSTVRVTADYYARWADGELQEAHSRYSPGAKLPIIKPRGKI